MSEDREQLNVEIPVALKVEIKKIAASRRTKVYAIVDKFLSWGVWLTNSLGLTETFKVMEESRPLALLMAARDDLSKQRFPYILQLDAVIDDVEAWLNRKVGGKNVEV